MAGIKERLIQVILRGKDLLSPEANKSKKALEELVFPVCTGLNRCVRAKHGR